VRLPERVRRLFSGTVETTERVGLLDVARALLTEDDEEAERVARALSRDRKQRDQERAEQAEQQARRERAQASARALRRYIERCGSWFPGDGPF
jgi:hypothetical protein